MKYIKAILFLTLSLMILFLTVAIFMPSEAKIERSIEINSPVGIVFSQIADLTNFNKWNTLYAEEPDAFLPIKGESRLGQFSEWKGKIVGAGKITNTKVVENTYIEQKIEFSKPFSPSLKVWFVFNESGYKTKVTWGASGQLSYPIERYLKVPIEIRLNNSFNSGLSNLKSLCEKIYNEKHNNSTESNVK